MANIFWLASYPKSGNTWMRIFLNNYRREAVEPININKLEGGPIASARIWFDEWVGIEASALDDATIERLRPDVYRCMAREEIEPLYMKVHDAWSLSDQNEGLFPAEITGGVVYILRNPLDMAASCAHHWGVCIEQAVSDLCNIEYTLARTIGGIGDQLRQKLGSWSKHVTSWIDDSGLPVHLVRYEDLRRDPLFFFGSVVHFCGMHFDAELVSRAVSFSDFSELQRQEKINDFRERPPKSTGAFFRKGEVGSWREELPEHLVRRLIDSHGEIMHRFGYLDENGQPV